MLDSLPLEFVGLKSICLLRRLVRTRQIKIKKKRRGRRGEYSIFADGPFTDENLVKVQAKILSDKLGKLIEGICSDVQGGKSGVEMSLDNTEGDRFVEDVKTLFNTDTEDKPKQSSSYSTSEENVLKPMSSRK